MMTAREYDYLVVGAGLFGATFAYQARTRGKKCLVIDKRMHLGGNVYCEEVDGITVHKYGPHVFHTNDLEVWEFVNRFVSFNRFTLNTIARYKDRLYNLPFNMYTFYQIWGVIQPEEAMEKIELQRREAGIETPRNLEEQAISLVGRDVYEVLVKGYTEKQWGRLCVELPASIIKRLPVRFTFNNNYFDDRYQGVPTGGYNVLIDGLLKGIECRTDCNYLEDRAYFDTLADRVIYTGPIDEYFGGCLGDLEYRSLRFEQELVYRVSYQGNAVMNYTERTVPFTRIIEHQFFDVDNVALQTLPYTVITREYPEVYTMGTEPYYPVGNEQNMNLYSAYLEMGQCKVPDTIFAGRLGSYKYMDMDQTLSAALKLSKELL